MQQLNILNFATILKNKTLIIYYNKSYVLVDIKNMLL